MGLLSGTDAQLRVSKPKTESEFVPAGDDYLSQYISEINTESSKLSDENFDKEEIPDFVNDDSDLIKQPSAYAQKRGQTTARFAVTTLDKIIASMVAVYAHSENVADFQADDDDLEDLAEQWGVYFTEANLDLPPWVFALITTGFVLMKKFNAAGPLRTLNIERAKNRKEIAALQNQVELLTEEKKVLQLKKQVEEMKPGNNDQ